MAAVYAATHRNGRQVAVKLLHPELAMHKEARTRFTREGLVANRVRHPGVVVILDDDVTEDGAAFLVMELLEGATLEELWSRHGERLPLPVVIAAGVALLDVLASAHAAGVVHRDIKPANVFLTSGWQIKVLDFGVSRLDSAPSATATQTGATLGSPAFMAPEQALGKNLEVDARTDVWAAAATLFTLASGRYVHEGETGQEVLIHAATAAARPVSSVAPGVPEALAAVIDRGLAFTREARWSSASEMAAALGEASRVAFGDEPNVSAFAAVLPFAPPAGTGSTSLSMPTSPEPMRPSLLSASHGGGQFATSAMGTPGDPGGKSRARLVVFALAGLATLGVGLGLVVAFSRVSPRSGGDAPAGLVAQQASSSAPGAAASTSASSAALPGENAPPDPLSAAYVDAAPPAPGTAAIPGKPATPTRAGGRSGAGATQGGQATTRSRSFIPGSSQGPPPPPADPCVPPYRFDFFGNKVLKPGCS
jgi:serine/threonine-protein kinase